MKTGPKTRTGARPHDPAISAALLAWYDRHHRELPWRVSPGMRKRGIIADPYHVWLSEVMLQQTTVQAVKPYFRAFVEAWPKVTDLAAADTEDVMKAWAGLGYYARARNLKKCAETVAERHQGHFPGDEDGLRTLPGIGDYTAAAIAAIAFDQPAAVMDGNIERVVSRLYRIGDPLPGAKPAIKARVAEITPDLRPGDFAQAMMDLGATICSPKRPACSLCPLNAFCQAHRQGDASIYPVKAAKKEKPVRLGAAFVAIDPDGALLIRKRPDRGLLGGMTEVPNTDWTSRKDGETGIKSAPFDADWHHCGIVTHVFTHFELRLTVWHAAMDTRPQATGWWEPQASIDAQALPSVMKKAIALAMDHQALR